MTVDGRWSLVGSSNWDPRSLRLNFELDVEIFCTECSALIDDLIQEKIERGREITLAEVDARPLPTRVLHGVARLLSPYL